MPGLSRFLKKDKFSVNVLLLIAGTVLSQAIPVLISPILTRIYSPEDFGLFAVYFGITMVASVLVTGRYEMAIMLPKEDKDATDIIALCVLITFLISLLALCIVLLFSSQIEILTKVKAKMGWMIFIPISILLIGLNQTFNYWFNRKEYYKQLSLNRISRSLNSGLFSIGLGVTFLKKVGLILGDIIGQTITTIFIIVKALRYNRGMFSTISIEGIKRNALRYNQFPKFNVPSGLLEKVSGQLPVFILTSFYSATVSGLFALSQRVIAAPSSIISRSIGDVFRQQASVEYLQNGNCYKSFIKMFRMLFFISIVPFIIFFFTAPVLFEFVFGEKWLIAGKYAQIMTIMFFLQFIVSPLSNMFLVAEKQRLDFLLQLFLIILMTISMVIGVKCFETPQFLVIFFTISYSIKYCIEFYLSLKFSKGLTVFNL